MLGLEAIKLLYSWVQEQIATYSFIEKVEFKNAIFHMYYKRDGTQKCKRIPYRATKEQLVRALDSIKKEIGFVEIKKKRDIEIRKKLKDSPFFFGVSNEDTNGD